MGGAPGPKDETLAVDGEESTNEGTEVEALAEVDTAPWKHGNRGGKKKRGIKKRGACSQASKGSAAQPAAAPEAARGDDGKDYRSQGGTTGHHHLGYAWGRDQALALGQNAWETRDASRGAYGSKGDSDHGSKYVHLEDSSVLEEWDNNQAERWLAWAGAMGGASGPKDETLAVDGEDSTAEGTEVEALAEVDIPFCTRGKRGGKKQRGIKKRGTCSQASKGSAAQPAAAPEAAGCDDGKDYRSQGWTTAHHHLGYAWGRDQALALGQNAWETRNASRGAYGSRGDSDHGSKNVHLKEGLYLLRGSLVCLDKTPCVSDPMYVHLPDLQDPMYVDVAAVTPISL